MARNTNPFKLDDHYDESFTLEDDDDDEDSPLEDIPQQSRYNQHQSPSGYESSEQRVPSVTRNNRPSSARHGARSARAQSGRFRAPQPPTQPQRASDRVGRIGGNYEGDSENDDSSELESTDDEFHIDATKANTRPKGPEPPKPLQRYPSENSESDDSEPPGGQNSSASEEGSSEGDDDSDSSEAGYRPQDYSNLHCSKEIKDLFLHILRYKPQKKILDTKLKPFIPEFVPAVGDIDAFLKIPRPDNQDEKHGLGWRILDEPSLKQTDPAVLDQQLKTLGKDTIDAGGGNSGQMNFVHKVENAEKDSKRIESWIDQITDLNRSKPSQTVTFSKPMPDVESIMSVWPGHVDDKVHKIPSAEDLDCSLEEYAKMLCTLFDVPVYEGDASESDPVKNNNLIQSLHVLFSTYSQFKQLDFAQDQLASSTNLAGTSSSVLGQARAPGTTRQKQQQQDSTQFSNVMTFN